VITLYKPNKPAILVMRSRYFNRKQMKKLWNSIINQLNVKGQNLKENDLKKMRGEGKEEE